MHKPVTPAQLKQYRDDGYFILHDFLTPYVVAQLSQRIDDLMDGKIRREGMSFQKDPGTTRYDDVVHDKTGFAGPSREYRKIKGFEYDDLFLRLFQSTTIKSICEALIGPNVSSMRAMLFNKPALHGADLPYHQDVSANWPMTALPELTIWIPFDAATVESGCMEFVVGSHKHGQIGDGHMLRTEDEAEYAPTNKRRMMELKVGEAVVFHCALLHRSGANLSPQPRRAMTLCLMDGAIRHTKSGRQYPMIFGKDALDPERVTQLDRIELVAS